MSRLAKLKAGWESLSGRKVVLVFFINIGVIAAVYLFFGWFLNSSGVFFSFERSAVGFTYREAGLCLAFAFIINGAITYFMIVRPLWNLEDSIQKFMETMRGDEFSPSSGEFQEETIESVLRYLMKQQEVSHEKNKIEEKQRKKAEIYALQNQIDPHFLYNALDSIRGYALIHDMDEISEITEALSRVFRNMISDKHELLTLRQERDNIYNYMKIQQFRFNNKFDYSFEIEEELLDKYMVPRMVLQPLVENAIMHGLERKVKGGWVRVTAYETEKRFVLDVTDNGAGISEERLKLLNRAMKLKPGEYTASEESRHAGIALININRRIKLNFGSQYGINLSSTPDIRTTTEVVLPRLLNRK